MNNSMTHKFGRWRTQTLFRKIPEKVVWCQRSVLLASCQRFFCPPFNLLGMWRVLMHLVGPLKPVFCVQIGHLLRCQLCPLYLEHIWSETCIKSDLIKQSCGLSGQGSAFLQVSGGFLRVARSSWNKVKLMVLLQDFAWRGWLFLSGEEIRVTVRKDVQKQNHKVTVERAPLHFTCRALAYFHLNWVNQTINHQKSGTDLRCLGLSGLLM